MRKNEDPNMIEKHMYKEIHEFKKEGQTRLTRERPNTEGVKKHTTHVHIHQDTCLENLMMKKYGQLLEQRGS